ncbi:MAG: hypothetical protein ABGW74_02090 [Campylobacterales bacterium]
MYREPIEIDYEEFKEYKATLDIKKDNFRMLLDFIRLYYSMSNVFDIYNTLLNDELAKMMLDKREIDEPMKLEKYLYRPM